jgi:hypothetical protein
MTIVNKLSKFSTSCKQSWWQEKRKKKKHSRIIIWISWHKGIRKQAEFPLTFLAYPKNPVAPLKPTHDKLVPIKG